MWRVYFFLGDQLYFMLTICISYTLSLSVWIMRGCLSDWFYSREWWAILHAVWWCMCPLYRSRKYQLRRCFRMSLRLLPAAFAWYYQLSCELPCYRLLSEQCDKQMWIMSCLLPSMHGFNSLGMLTMQHRILQIRVNCLCNISRMSFGDISR